MEKGNIIGFIRFIKLHFKLWLIINIVLMIGIQAFIWLGLIPKLENEIQSVFAIKSISLSQEDKNEMNYEALREDIRYMYTGKGNFNAKLEMQFGSGTSVGNSYLNKSIDEIDLNKIIIGGKEPIKFYKVSGPDWINVSEDGIVSGTPTEFANEDKLTVKAVDSEGSTAEGTLKIPSVLEESEYRESKTGPAFHKAKKYIEKAGHYEPYVYHGEGYFIKREEVTDAKIYGIYKKSGDKIREINLGGEMINAIVLVKYIIIDLIKVVAIDIVLNYLFYKIVCKANMKKEKVGDN